MATCGELTIKSPGCSSDADCPSGQVCQDGQCVDEPDDQFDPSLISVSCSLTESSVEPGQEALVDVSVTNPNSVSAIVDFVLFANGTEVDRLTASIQPQVSNEPVTFLEFTPGSEGSFDMRVELQNIVEGTITAEPRYRQRRRLPAGCGTCGH